MIGAEFWRGVSSRVRHRKEDLLSGVLNLVLRDNRRWGGYLVHVGIAILTIGIGFTLSGMQHQPAIIDTEPHLFSTCPDAATSTL